MLRQIVLRKRIGDMRRQLADISKKDDEFQARAAALAVREAELIAAVEETSVDTLPEDQSALEAETTAYEDDKSALAIEAAALDESKKKLEEEIRLLENELKEIDGRTSAPQPVAPVVEPQQTERKEEASMKTRGFNGQTMEQRSAYLARTEVKDFYTRLREMIGQKRTVTGAELAIPEITLELLRDNIHRYSKLLKHVNVRPVSGKGRQTIMGAIPEGVWTEAVGKLNDLDLAFTQIEVDGYKVGGYIPVPNSTLEDSDIALANEIEDALGQAVGLALDKAILYGTGTKMPWGIVTRLAQQSKPSSWGTNAPTWTDLHTTNLLSLNPASYSTGAAFFAALILKLGVAAPNYSNGQIFWAMNRKTWMTLLSKALEFNANGAIVAGMNMTMPVIGGAIEILDFLGDDDIIGGFGSLYLLAERKGATIGMSEHVMFVEDQTVFKGSARYDGMPVFGEAFVGVNINNSTVDATKSFPSDDANPQ